MSYTITNRARRIVTFRSNSGHTWHLPPQTVLDLPTIEVTENAKILKLAANGILAVRQQSRKTQPKSPSTTRAQPKKRPRRTKGTE